MGNKGRGEKTKMNKGRREGQGERANNNKEFSYVFVWCLFRSLIGPKSGQNPKKKKHPNLQPHKLICCVAGATRGCGRSVAVELGRTGATVYVTGRGAKSDAGRPSETLEGTAKLINEAGGVGIPVVCDHTDAEQVKALFERIKQELGEDERLDVLVNSVWGADFVLDESFQGGKFWELGVEKVDKHWVAMERGVKAHLLTAAAAIPLMLKKQGGEEKKEETPLGVIIEMTDGVGEHYRGNVIYDLSKNGNRRTVLALSHELDLDKHGVSVIGVTPGFLRSEAMLDRFGVTEENWRDHVEKDKYWAFSETPTFVARGVAALVVDEKEKKALNGCGVASWTLGKKFQVDDVNGERPDWGKVEAELFGKDTSPVKFLIKLCEK